MRRIGRLKDSFLSFGNLYLAFKKAYKATKSYEAHDWAVQVDRKLFTLHRELAEQTYRPDKYRYFRIYEPKERVISAASFKDRVVHHALINILEPIYEKRFIFHSYATRKNKGMHKAVIQARRMLCRGKYYLKMDIRQYFASIDHNVLQRIIARRIKDPYALWLCNVIIGQGGDGHTGIPIGNLTSQFFANVYLDIFDHFVKDELGIKYYVRYMDDFVLFSNDKAQIKKWRLLLTDFLADHLLLFINAKSTVINHSQHGLSYLGTRIFANRIRLHRINQRRSYRKLMTKVKMYENAIISDAKFMDSVNSHIAYLKFWRNSPA